MEVKRMVAYRLMKDKDMGFVFSCHENKNIVNQAELQKQNFTSDRGLLDAVSNFAKIWDKPGALKSNSKGSKVLDQLETSSFIAAVLKKEYDDGETTYAFSWLDDTVPRDGDKKRVMRYSETFEVDNIMDAFTKGFERMASMEPYIPYSEQEKDSGKSM